METVLSWVHASGVLMQLRMPCPRTLGLSNLNHAGIIIAAEILECKLATVG